MTRSKGGKRADPYEPMTAVDHATQYNGPAALRMRKTA